MKVINTFDLPLAANVCEQMLREVDRQGTQWAMAHVVMNPGASSLLHEHRVMTEIYVITNGVGEVVCGDQVLGVGPGNVIVIPPNTSHMATNTGAGALEHLVFTSPAFDPADVYMVPEHKKPIATAIPLRLPALVECFDGAKIMPYEFALDMTMAVGWVINDPKRVKKAHYHTSFTEYIFILEGRGALEIDGERTPIKAGDWITVFPGESHALHNNRPQYMVALCMCMPRFSMEDIHYK